MDIKEINYRIMSEKDSRLLEDFLYEAIFIPEGVTPPPKDIILRPELRLYYEGFGTRTGDLGIAAEHNGQAVGACWTRIMNDYGHVDDDTPSFAISLYKKYRGMGIGTELMRKVLALLKENGYKKASLAVQKENYAVRMYEKAGFCMSGENEEEYIMVVSL